jgi:aryl-alcohol dehydrogenase-like predicted oxidoreductase
MNGATMGATNLGSTTTTKITNYPLSAWYVVAWDYEVVRKPIARTVGDTPLALYRTEDVFDENLRRVQEIVAVGNEVGATPAQVSLAWLLAKGAGWVPIPGTIRIPHLEEDLGAVDVSLTADQMTRLDNITQPLGDHHSAAQMAMFDR